MVKGLDGNILATVHYKASKKRVIEIKNYQIGDEKNMLKQAFGDEHAEFE